MEKVKVSVMFMSYNHGAYIRQAMDSVLRQTFRNYEVILSDDCSCDNTKEMLSGYQDSRITMHFFEENQGAVMNCRYIWQHCQGEYLALINSDDVWLPEHLEKSVDYMDAHPECGAVFSWAATIDEEDRIIDPCCDVFRQPNRSQAEWIHHLFTKGNCLCHPSMVIRREVYDTVGFYKSGFRQLPDFNMWTRMVNHYPLHILEEVLVYHRRCIHTNQNTSAPLVENSIRDVNESLCTLFQYFENMPDRLFLEAFGKEFRNRKAEAPAELLCEKFFLMYDEKYYMHGIARFMAFIYLHGIYDEQDVKEILKNQYGFTLKDFHELGAETDFLGLKKRPIMPEDVALRSKNAVSKILFWKKGTGKTII